MTDIRTSRASDWPASRIREVKGNQRIAVVIPARNEQATVGEVVRLIAADLGDVIDDLIVMDSLSEDATAESARQAGAQVHSVADVRPDLGVRAGKGEALWKSLFVTNADLLVFVDADLSEWGTHFVTGLLGPLLDEPEVMLVRGFYDRVLDIGTEPSLEGGRVTELVARPWIALHRPQLADVVQPLAGEWAIRRSALEQLCIPVGYGIELATLLDIEARFGVGAIAQVDLGRRAHRHQSLHDLGAMALELLAVAERRLIGTPATVDGAVVMRTPLADRTWSRREVATGERPPHAGVR